MRLKGSSKKKRRDAIARNHDILLLIGDTLHNFDAEFTDTALRDAAAHGVPVRIVVADWALRQAMQTYLKSLAVLPHISVKYRHVPAASRGFIPNARVEHCKYAVANDDAVYIGTGNWTRSYFDASVDAALFLHDASAAATLNHIFERAWNGRYVHTIEPGGHYKPPRTL